VLHAILVDGMIERIEGNSNFVSAEVDRRRYEGHTSAYLFAASSKNEFERKRRVCCLVIALRDK
jgi:hypothetical protein